MKKRLLLLCLLLTSCAATRQADEITLCLGVCLQIKYLEASFESAEQTAPIIVVRPDPKK
jgi:hypothetical protein